MLENRSAALEVAACAFVTSRMLLSGRFGGQEFAQSSNRAQRMAGSQIEQRSMADTLPPQPIALPFRQPTDLGTPNLSNPFPVPHSPFSLNLPTQPSTSPLALPSTSHLSSTLSQSPLTSPFLPSYHNSPTT